MKKKLLKQQKNNRQIIVVCHNIRSAHNIGSIFRTADAAGISRIILGGYSAHPPNPKISKTALGAENNVPHERVWRIDKIIETLKKEGFLIVALENPGDTTANASGIPKPQNIFKFTQPTQLNINPPQPSFEKGGGSSLLQREGRRDLLNQARKLSFRPCFPLALILGNEVRGLSKEILARCDEIIYIPMLGKKESLNVSVAFGVAVYQIISNKSVQ